ncbi:uncharacterized protein LOC133904884 isoform X1 [Phragmites australis]|uniref:uncharacterized protein LOC133904884 isoform X1 n=1 Tax=Phragmites australis TaxID=29695 RepID=UPI002D77A42B|nr:uncharacterized protein LOC133904884 isoform X1 [Phragmites australis]XP_062202496.1 uncharacterized protein LOC133904884 isoform X1 [Phragmites australis]XP_062202497.1 uncharacterized protein LOC133904884 isoform X1 [Phragmites australis]XP_062202498.1 uncharacterized protein LOC133904884 isoform X1 [Phragmites australis]XP_062202499.1 uncharacterized protein LOC133904884 isoform X1 [Phragmites australis]XP_062202500.1 uncharacterized protein LOC133904884 isoform X1 [Phragmites australis]
MASFTCHDGSEAVTSSMSQESGNTAQASECSVPAIPHTSAEYNSSELGVDQTMDISRKQLLPIIPSGAPIFVSEKQYDAILRLRERRARIEARREKVTFKVKVFPTEQGPNFPIGDYQFCSCHVNTTFLPLSYYHFCNYCLMTQKHLPKGFKGRSAAIKCNQEGTSGGSRAATSTPAIDFFYSHFVATNEDEENTGEVAYNNILNLEAPDFTMLLRIMMGDRFSTEVAEQFKNVARLEAPDFATLLTVMNNAGYNEALDDGHYDVDKVMLKLEGW